MKKVLWVLATILTLASSCSSNIEHTAKGIIIDASMNSIIIADTATGDTIFFSTIDSEVVTENGILIGDQAEVFYKGNLTANNAATKVIITPSAPSPLLGGWVEPIPGIGGEQGILFEKAGVASSINMHTLVYNSWEQKGDTLILTGESIGNDQTIEFTEKAYINKLDADSLILTMSTNLTVRYSKQQ